MPKRSLIILYSLESAVAELICKPFARGFVGYYSDASRAGGKRASYSDRKYMNLFSINVLWGVNILIEAIRMKISELDFPKAMNIGLLAEILPEKKLMALIISNWAKERKQRRIVLPSKSCLKKVVCYYYGKQIAEGKMNWNQAMKKLKKGFNTLKEAGLEREAVKRLFLQRQRERQREKRDNDKLY